MLDKPKRVFGVLGSLALLFIDLHAFGSSGRTKGEIGFGQRVANISTPLLELTVLAMIVFGVIYFVRWKRRQRSGRSADRLES